MFCDHCSDEHGSCDRLRGAWEEIEKEKWENKTEASWEENEDQGEGRGVRGNGRCGRSHHGALDTHVALLKC